MRAATSGWCGGAAHPALIPALAPIRELPSREGETGKTRHKHDVGQFLKLFLFFNFFFKFLFYIIYKVKVFLT